MSARILLVASNLAVPAMTAAAGGLVRGLASGAIVTTAEIKLNDGEAILIEGVASGEPVPDTGVGATPLSPGFRTTFIRS